MTTVTRSTPASQAVLLPRRSTRRIASSTWALARLNPPGAVSVLFLAGMALLAVLAPLIAPYDPEESTRGASLLAPGTAHWFGTDNLGRDLFSRVLHGGRISLSVGIAVAVIGTAIGSCLGVFSAYFGGKTDLFLQRVVDCLDAFPTLVLALLFVAVLGPSVLNVVMALCIVSIPGRVRTVRSVALSVKESEYVLAARSMGATHGRVVFRHVLPNCFSPIMILASAAVGAAILAESSLSFLGLGIPVNVPTWGGMLGGQALLYVRSAWWLAVFPGLVLSLTVLAVNLLGDMLRDILDPRLRGSGGRAGL